MPATFTDQFFPIDPFSPPPAGTPMVFSLLTFTDQNDDNEVGTANDDSVGGIDITSSFPGDTVTVNVPGVGNITYTGITFYLADGTQQFTPTDGQILQNGALVAATFVTTQGPLNIADLGPPCFVSGTRIRTPKGDVAIETLKEGDMVCTLDRGPQPVIWHGQSTVCGLGRDAPVRISKGYLGNYRTMLVSPQHRILVSGWRVQLMFARDEILAPAIKLVNGTSVCQRPQRLVTYHHLAFEAHEIICGDGAWSESFFMEGLHKAQCDRSVTPSAEGRETARTVVQSRDVGLLSQAT